MNCERCYYTDDGKKVYFECCCDYDKLTVIADDEKATKEGYIKLNNGDWIKMPIRKSRGSSIHAKLSK
jgi:hypothetical protein